MPFEVFVLSYWTGHDDPDVEVFLDGKDAMRAVVDMCKAVVEEYHMEDELGPIKTYEDALRTFRDHLGWSIYVFIRQPKTDKRITRLEGVDVIY